MKRSVFLSLVFCAATSPLYGCGGGGGGGTSDPSYSGSADVSVQATPSKIDTGDRTEVSIDISNVNPNGIALKIRYPNGLQYVPSSAKLLTQDKETDLTPTFNLAAPSEPQMYLVFYLKQRSFRPAGEQYNGQSGTVVLQLVGMGAVDGGDIDVDPDVDDRTVDNAVEFNVNQPQFVPESSAGITVITR
jgi:hypothetical protein